MTNARRARSIAAWIAWTGWSALLGCSIALLISTVLFGRLPISHLASAWPRSVTLAGASVAVTGWWLAYAWVLRLRRGQLRLRDAIIPSLPLFVVVTVPVIAIYSSDVVHHYFYFYMVYLNQPKPLTLLLVLLVSSAVLQVTQLASARVSFPLALSLALGRVGEHFTLLLLLALGILQSSAYLGRLYDDFFLRYWPVADALSTGVPYPAAVVAGLWQPFFVEGGLARYLIDLPLYPALVAGSFAVFGHTTVGAFVPTIVSNALLPPTMYLLFRELIRSRALALSMVALVTLFPPFRFYALNLTFPDPTFFTLLMATCWLFVKVVKGESRTMVWALFGLSSAAITLTRPEGIAYAGIFFAAFALSLVPSAVRLGERARSIWSNGRWSGLLKELKPS